MNNFTSSTNLASFRRADVIIKLLLAQHPSFTVGGCSPRDLYQSHLRCWNNFQETSPKRDTFQDFLDAFSSVGQATSPIDLPPIVLGSSHELLNGSHRLAHALARNWPIKYCIGDLTQGQDNVTIEYLQSLGYLKGLPSSVKDFLVHYALWASRRQSLIVLWDSAYLPQLLDLLAKTDIRVVARYHSNAGLSSISLHEASNLVRIIYCDNPWMFDTTDNPLGAIHKAKQVTTSSPISFLLVESDTSLYPSTCLHQRVADLKISFRKATQTGHSVIHTADTFHQVWSIFSSLCHSSSFSLASLLSQRFKRGMLGIQSISHSTCIDEYWNFAITGTMAMKLYGIDVTPNDLDLVCSKGSIFNPLYGHDSQRQFYPFEFSEILSNPAFTYSHMGLRVLKPTVLLLMKETRREIKDQQHVSMIKSLLRAAHSNRLRFVKF